MACYDWLTNQKRASFKGVYFEVSEDGREGGRRIQTHEYASSETWDNEDLGRRKLLIHVTGLVDGFAGPADRFTGKYAVPTAEDASNQSEALIAACSSPGPGLLVLPNRPSVMAVCDQISSTWQKNALGFYAVQMSFTVESVPVVKPFSYTQFAGAIDIAAEAALAAAGNAFSLGFDTVLRRFSPARFVPATARDAAGVTIAMAADALDTLRQQCRMDAARGAEAAFAARRMKANAAALAFQGQSPDLIAAQSFVANQASVDNGFAGAFLAAVRVIVLAADPVDLAAAVPVLTGFAAQHIPGSTRVFSVRAEQGLTLEVARFVNRVGLAVWMKALGRIRFRDRRIAIAARAGLVQAFGDEALDEMRGALDATVTYLGAVSRQLPSDRVLTFYQSLPAVVVATRLYADPARAAELVARNGDCDPLYMPTSVFAAAA